MAKTDIRLPPDIIRAIEEIVTRGGTAQIRNIRGILKVQSVSAKLEAAQEI